MPSKRQPLRANRRFGGEPFRFAGANPLPELLLNAAPLSKVR